MLSKIVLHVLVYWGTGYNRKDFLSLQVNAPITWVGCGSYWFVGVCEAGGRGYEWNFAAIRNHFTLIL